MDQFEKRAVEIFRNKYQKLAERGPDAYEHSPYAVALHSACSTCLEILGLDNEQDFKRKYGLGA
jgi:hypothetical protein